MVEFFEPDTPMLRIAEDGKTEEVLFRDLCLDENSTVKFGLMEINGA